MDEAKEALDTLLAIEPDHPDGKKFHEKVSKALRSKHEDIGKYAIVQDKKVESIDMAKNSRYRNTAYDMLKYKSGVVLALHHLGEFDHGHN